MPVANSTVSTTLGDLLLVADDHALLGLYFPAHRYPPAEGSTGDRVDLADHSVLRLAADELTAYLAGRSTSFTVPIDPRGPDFDRKVWKMLVRIPFGETTTYGALAVQMGNRHLAQRVGRAVGHNPISIVVPCHRVVGADGGLTGFAGGLERKQHLLELEEPQAKADARLF